MNKLDAEIFAVGTWNGLRFTLEDLKAIAATFAELENYHKVPLKFGHNDKQPMTDGQPALGWVERVWVSGSKLMATFSNVPDIVKKAVETKLYRKVSIELDIDVEFKSKRYSYVLSGVALLGADIPAVSTLADLDTYIGGQRVAASRRAAFSAIDDSRPTKENAMPELTKEEVTAIVSQAITAAVAPLSDAIKAKDVEILAFRKKDEERDAEAKKAKVELARKAVTDVFEAAVKQGAITPAQREKFKKTLKVDEDDAVLAINVDELKELVGGSKVKFGKSAGLEGDRDDDGDTKSRVHADAGEELHRLARLEMDSNPKLAYTRALEVASEKNHDLAKEWLGASEEE